MHKRAWIIYAHKFTAHWRCIIENFIVRGAFILAIALLTLVLVQTSSGQLVGVAEAQSSAVSAPQAVSQQGPLSDMLSDRWFWVMVAAWLFSSIVSGMPEPETDSSPWYIWAYRSLHLITATGTAYFQHKAYWPKSLAGAGEEPSTGPKKIGQ